MAVLSIITTAPLGAVLIAIYGPKLLIKESSVETSNGIITVAKLPCASHPLSDGGDEIKA